MQMYYYYIRNFVENKLDNFFCYFDNNKNFFLHQLDFLDWRLFFIELKDNFFLYFLNGYFLKFFFFLKNQIKKMSLNNYYMFFFFFILSDFYFFIFSFFSSHVVLSIKIYDDYVHNFSRRNVLKILAFFILVFLFIFFLFYFFLI